MRCISSHARDFWWPRRKIYECAQTSYNAAGRQRSYNTQTTETGFSGTPQDIPFIDGFPERLIREGLPARLNVRKPRKQHLRYKTRRRTPLDRQDSKEINPGLQWQEPRLAHPFVRGNVDFNAVTLDFPAFPMDFASHRDFSSSSIASFLEVTAPSEDLANPSDSGSSTTTDPTSPTTSTELHVASSEDTDLSAVSAISGPIILPKDDSESAEMPPSQEGVSLYEYSQIPDILPAPNEVPTYPTEVEKRSIRHLIPRTGINGTKSSPSRTIYVLGSDTHAKFVAHSIAGQPFAPPVTLLLHNSYLMKRWREEGAAVKILRNGKLDVKTKIGVEYSGSDEQGGRGFQGNSRKKRYVSPETIIENLIVTTEGNPTLPALAAIIPRLRPWSTILFLQDGMGIIDKLNDKLFPDPSTRPYYAIGNTTHKLTPTENSFTIIERKSGSINFSTLIREPKRGFTPWNDHRAQPLVRRIDGYWGPFRHILQTLSQAPELKVATLSRPYFHLKQLQKLAVNSVLGPLSVLHDCSNEQLLHNHDVSRTMRLALQETSVILQSLPEISRVRNVNGAFSAGTLEKYAISILKTSGRNNTEMLNNFRAGQRSGIEFYNGYLVDRAKELGIPAPHNEMLLSLVKGKMLMRNRRDGMYIPIRNEG